MIEIKNFIEWLDSWYPRAGTETRSLSDVVSALTSLINGKVSINQGSGNENKNVVTNSAGNISLEEKISLGSGLSFDGNVQNKINHSNSTTPRSTSAVYKTTIDSQGHVTASAEADAGDILYDSQNSISDAIGGLETAIASKAPKTNGAGNITDANAGSYANIGSFTSSSTQADINSAINTIIGALKGTKFIEIENKPTNPSESTLGKLYIVTESGAVNVYYTKQTGTGSSATYSWEKLDANILDDLADATQSVHGLMSTSDKIKLDLSQSVVVTSFTGYAVDASSSKLTLDVNNLYSFGDGSVFICNLENNVISYINSNYRTISDYDVYVRIYDTNLSYPLNAKVKDVYLSGSTGFASLIYLRHWTGVGRRAYLLNKNARDHKHSISNIDSLQTTLNGKQDKITSYALVPKGNNPDSDEYKGIIRFYTGDEPT